VSVAIRHDEYPPQTSNISPSVAIKETLTSVKGTIAQIDNSSVVTTKQYDKDKKIQEAINNSIMMVAVSAGEVATTGLNATFA